MKISSIFSFFDYILALQPPKGGVLECKNLKYSVIKYSYLTL